MNILVLFSLILAGFNIAQGAESYAAGAPVLKEEYIGIEKHPKLLGFDLRRMPNVGVVYRKRDGENGWVVFKDKTYQLFGPDGSLLTERLNGRISLVEWQPNGNKAILRFVDGSAQLYDKHGMQMGDRLEKVRFIKWQPNGKQYWTIFEDDTAQLYDKHGDIIGDPLSNVVEIYWQPNGDKSLVLFEDGTFRLCTKDGALFGGVLGEVEDVVWWPDGKYYVVKHQDNSMQYYTEYGRLVKPWWETEVKPWWTGRVEWEEQADLPALDSPYLTEDVAFKRSLSKYSISELIESLDELHKMEDDYRKLGGSSWVELEKFIKKTNFIESELNHRRSEEAGRI